MLCEAVRTVRMIVRPWAGEFSPEEWRWLETHLSECASCRNWWQRESAWDYKLQQALVDVRVPQGLPESIAARLAGAWRQRWHSRAVSLALAASLLLTATLVLVGYYLFAYSTLDLAALSGPIPIPEYPSAENVTRLLEEHGVYLPSELQRRWDFRHLKAIYYTYEQGRWLCNLEFRREDSGAQVVVKIIPRRWCRGDQIESVRYQPGIKVLGVEEAGPYIALVIGDPDHIASFYQGGDPAS